MYEQHLSSQESFGAGNAIFSEKDMVGMGIGNGCFALENKAHAFMVMELDSD